MKHIGIVGVTAEGASLCYRTIVSEAGKKLGQYHHPEISLHNVSFHEIFQSQTRGDWENVANIILYSVKKLAASGADFIIMPANSTHFVFDRIKKKSPVPFLSLVELTAQECRKRGMKRVLVLGVGMTMRDKLYKKNLERYGIEHVVPTASDQKVINEVIMDEIVPAKVSSGSVKKITGIIEKMKKDGCDGVILGCTELPIVIDDKSSPLPAIDTTRLLAQKALEYAIS